MSAFLFTIGIFALGVAIGRFAHIWYRRLRGTWAKIRYGVCLHYKPRPYVETIDGTVSVFCSRCGHPRGYHDWGKY